MGFLKIKIITIVSCQEKEKEVVVKRSQPPVVQKLDYNSLWDVLDVSCVKESMPHEWVPVPQSILPLSLNTSVPRSSNLLEMLLGITRRDVLSLVTSLWRSRMMKN